MGAPRVMEGDGQYNAHSAAQAAAGGWGRPLLAEAARTMPLPGGTATIVDYGASQGKNSLAPIGTAVDAARAVHGDGLQVCVVHTDLPGNDFASLFATVTHDPLTYLRPGVFVLAAARSFYEQIMPSGSVSLGWTSITLHWLSAAPGQLRGFWYATASPAEHAMWSRHAAQDWCDFLDARGKELAPGARLVIVVGAADLQGRSGVEGAMEMIDTALRDMVAAGTISAAEHAAMVVPAWYRTVDEWRLPFPRAGLDLERLDDVALGDPFRHLYESAGDAAGYAEALTASLRVSFGPSLLEVVPADRRDGVADELFDVRLRAVVAADPAAASPRWRLAVMVLVRSAG